MAVSQKKKPIIPDISESLKILNGESEIQQNNSQQIQTGAGSNQILQKNQQIQKNVCKRYANNFQNNSKKYVRSRLASLKVLTQPFLGFVIKPK